MTLFANLLYSADGEAIMAGRADVAAGAMPDLAAEIQIVTHAISGIEAAWELIQDRILPDVIRTARYRYRSTTSSGLDSLEDVVSDALNSIWQALPTWSGVDNPKEGIVGPQKPIRLVAFCQTIATRRSIAAGRRRELKNRDEVTESGLGEASLADVAGEDADNPAECRFAGEKRAAQALACMATDDAISAIEDRAFFVRRYVGGETAKSLAAEAGISPALFRDRMRRCRLRILSMARAGDFNSDPTIRDLVADYLAG